MKMYSEKLGKSKWLGGRYIYDLTIFMKLIYILVADNMIFDLVQFSTQLLHFSSTVYLSTMFVVDVLLKNRDFICTYWGFRGNDHWKFITCLWALAKHQFGFDLGDEKKKKLNLVCYVERNTRTWTIIIYIEIQHLLRAQPSLSTFAPKLSLHMQSYLYCKIK